MSPTFEELIAELSRDADRVQPRDPLQFCSNWFQQRLQEQRARLRDAVHGSQSSSKAVTSSNMGDHALGGGGTPLPADHFADATWTAAPQAPDWFSKSTSTTSPSSNPFDRRHISSGPGPFGTLDVPGNQARGAGRKSPFYTIPEESPSGEPASPPAPWPNSNSFPRNGGGANGASGPAPNTVASHSPIHHQFPIRQHSPNPGDFLHPPNVAFARRTSVSAESIIPNSSDNKPLPVFPKSPAQLSRIRAAITSNFIFRDLEEAQLKSALDAMVEVKIPANEPIIKQGDDGEYFYVVESGLLYCYIKSETGSIPPTSVNGYNPADSSSEYHAEFGNKVAECHAGHCFGELALMYGHPRAATVLSIEPSTLWSLDRITFRTIVLKAAHRRRTLYEHFLASVPLLFSLAPEERSKIADALMSKTCNDEEIVVEEGEMGDAFFFIEEGEASVTKRVQNDSGEWEDSQVGHLKKGDYFGELSLLHLAPRAATVRAIKRADPAMPKLKVAALGAAAFTRLLGPMREIMERKAGEAYGQRSAR